MSAEIENLCAENFHCLAKCIHTNGITDNAAGRLVDLTTAVVKLITQNSINLMYKHNRQKLNHCDIERAIKNCKFSTKFELINGSLDEVKFNGFKINDFVATIRDFNNNNSDYPTISKHWVAINGMQPIIKGNPMPQSKETQILEIADPAMYIDQIKNKNQLKLRIPHSIKQLNIKNANIILPQQLRMEQLSMEERLYLNMITQKCIGTDNQARTYALESLSNENISGNLLPRICIFITEGIKVNLAQHNLVQLVYLMRMVKALVDNKSINLEKYLHFLLPNILTCILCKQLCIRPAVDDHWALRNFTAIIIADICKIFNSCRNNLQTRVTRIYNTALENKEICLSSLYGVIIGLCQLGDEVIKIFIIPRLKLISSRVESYLINDDDRNINQIAAERICYIILKNCPLLLMNMRPYPDVSNQYKLDYGYLGHSLCKIVKDFRQKYQFINYC